MPTIRHGFEIPNLEFSSVLESKAFAVSKTTIKPHPPAPSIRQILPQMALLLQRNPLGGNVDVIFIDVAEVVAGCVKFQFREFKSMLTT
jgi:hypothetical protein